MEDQTRDPAERIKKDPDEKDSEPKDKRKTLADYFEGIK